VEYQEDGKEKLWLLAEKHPYPKQTEFHQTDDWLSP